MIVKITALWSVNKVRCRLVFSTSDQFLIMLYTYIVFPELGLQNCLIVVNKWDTIPNKNHQTATYYEQDFREKIHVLDWARIVYSTAIAGHNFKKYVQLNHNFCFIFHCPVAFFTKQYPPLHFALSLKKILYCIWYLSILAWQVLGYIVIALMLSAGSNKELRVNFTNYPWGLGKYQRGQEVFKTNPFSTLSPNGPKAVI